MPAFRSASLPYSPMLFRYLRLIVALSNGVGFVVTSVSTTTHPYALWRELDPRDLTACDLTTFHVCPPD